MEREMTGELNQRCWSSLVVAAISYLERYEGGGAALELENLGEKTSRYRE
jgi:hypothetical protein